MSQVKSGNFILMIGILARDMQRIKHNLQTGPAATDLQISGLIFRVEVLRSTTTASNESNTRLGPPGCNAQMTSCAITMTKYVLQILPTVWQENGLFHVMIHLCTAESWQQITSWSEVHSLKASMLSVCSSFSVVELLGKMKNLS